MPVYGVPNPPDGLMDRIKERLAEHQKAKKLRRRQLAIVVTVILLFALPASAYHIAREYRGFASGVKIAVEHEEGIKIGQKLLQEDLEVTIEHAVWEDDELVIVYSMSDQGFMLHRCSLVDENGSEIARAHYADDLDDGGIIRFNRINLGRVKGDQVWLRILSFEKKGLEPLSTAFKRVKVTPEMKEGEFAEINEELETEKGTYLVKHIRFGTNGTKINFEFIPKAQYRKFYEDGNGAGFLPQLGLVVAGKHYGSYAWGGSPLTKDGPVIGTIYFEAVPIEKDNAFQIAAFDHLVLVDWQIPIPVENKESARWELAEAIELSEGKLILTGIRHGTKSTSIDFTFEPAPGFEGISNVRFSAYLRSNGKYYQHHDFQLHSYLPGLSGTITFDPVRYDNVQELEFILGRLEYTYDITSTVVVSPGTIPQRIEVMGSSFTIDRMKYRNGQTLLHIAYDRENRWFYDADFKIDPPPHWRSRFSVIMRFEMGTVQLNSAEELKKGLEQLKNSLGEAAKELLKDVDLERGFVGANIEISGEHEEVEVSLVGLSILRYSGETIGIPLK